MYLPTGHLVYYAAGSIMAGAFDLQRDVLVGEPTPLVDHVRSTTLVGPEFSVSPDGSLAYVLSTEANTEVAANARTLTWVARDGTQSPLAAPPRAYTIPRLSPDDKQIAVDIRDQDNDIWIWDVLRSTLRQLTFDPANDVQPLWMPGGRRLLFASNRGNGAFNIFWQPADGTGNVERLTTSTNPHFPQAITPDTKRVLLLEQSPQTGNDVMMLTLGEKPQITPLIRTAFGESNPSLSPDGRWVAYGSSESGQTEVYVRPFPAVDAGRWRISTNGGNRSVWARNGRELFYAASDGAVMAVPVQTDHGFVWGTPTKLFDWPTLDRTNFGRSFDVARDGRFLMVKEPDERKGDDPGGSGIVVVLNWLEEVKQRVPTK
jgi:serine/threonine-protein kinase